MHEQPVNEALDTVNKLTARQGGETAKRYRPDGGRRVGWEFGADPSPSQRKESIVSD
jgi:hypothetical protein